MRHVSFSGQGAKVVRSLTALGLLEPAPPPNRLVATRAGRFVLNQLVLQLSKSFVACEGAAVANENLPGS